MFNCDHKMTNKTSRKKRAIDTPTILSPKIPFDVSLKPTYLPDPIEVVNKSHYDKYIYHELNISDPSLPVQVNLKHNLSFALRLYIGINAMPTDEKHLESHTVSMTHSVLISTEELSKFVNESSNGTVYVAVRSAGKHLIVCNM